MWVETHPDTPDSGDLNRFRYAARRLEQSGLGPLDWMGPVWMGLMADLERSAVDFAAARIHQDTRLHRRLRSCPDDRARQRLQKEALRACLAAFDAPGEARVTQVRLYIENECEQERL